MKDIIKKYAKTSEYFWKNKIYMSIIIIVSILGYGFTITNCAIGVDDLDLDRYVSGTWILSQGRWGTWLLYNILGIKSFTPFWLEFITVIILVITAVAICTFFKQNFDDKNITIVAYIILASAFISYPLINQSQCMKHVAKLL